MDGIQYHGWVTNSAGLNFHSYYGFGAVDAGAAVAAAQTIVADSLGEQATLEVPSAANHTLVESQEWTTTLNNPTSGVAEYVRVVLNLDAPGGTDRSIGIRLESPSGTLSTVLQPWSWANENLSADESIYLASSAFYGEAIAGDWKLHFIDHRDDGDQLHIETVSLEFFYR